MRLNDGFLAKGAELKRLLDEGHIPVPTRWVDTDKNLHLVR